MFVTYFSLAGILVGFFQKMDKITCYCSLKGAPKSVCGFTIPGGSAKKAEFLSFHTTKFYL